MRKRFSPLLKSLIVIALSSSIFLSVIAFPLARVSRGFTRSNVSKTQPSSAPRANSSAAGLSTFTVGPAIAVGGSNATGKVTLSAPAPAAGAVVLLSDNLASTEVPQSVSVPAGLTTKAFTIKTNAVAATQSGIVRATFGGITKTAPLTVRPIGVQSIKFANSTVSGGNNAVCEVVLERPAAPGGIRAAISSSNTGVATPTVSSILFPAGSRIKSFGIRTSPTTVTKSANIVAIANAVSKSGKLTVIPASTACSYSISPTSQQFTAAGGTGSVNVTAGANCSWTAVKNSNVAWVNLTGNTSGNGNGVINYSVAVNTGNTARTGSLTIAGKTFNITQAATSGGGETVSPAIVTLQGASRTAFNPLDSAVRFVVTNATLTPDAANVRVFRNQEFVEQNNISVVGNTVTLALPLVSGLNDLELISVDNQGRSIYAQFMLWAGGNTLNLSILDQNNQPLNGATVTALLNDDQTVTASAVSANGQVAFPNLPDRTIIFNARASGNRFATTALTGLEGSAQLVLKGFDPPSTVNNNDFSLGSAGWNTGTAPVQIIQHVEGSGLVASPDVDNDLQVSTASGVEGAQSISRTFKIDPGTKNVTVRFRFITTEVPGGYCGTKYNDYYSITIRSLSGGATMSEGQSMNGLGCNAFDSAGAIAWRELALTVNSNEGPPAQAEPIMRTPSEGQTAWREYSLPVSADGDTVQADISVANVGDGALQSRVVLDVVKEKKLKINSARLDDIDKTGLSYLSTDDHSYYGGITKVFGVISIGGAAEDSLSSVKLKIKEKGQTVAVADLGADAKTALLNKPFGQAGKLEITSSKLLFELPSAQAALVDRATAGNVSLEIEAQSQSGESVTKSAGSVGKLVRFKPNKRFGGRDTENCIGYSTPCGGDDWVSPNVNVVAEHFATKGVSWNDFSNMNGGYFPPHAEHRAGHDIDGKYDGYTNLNAATAQKMIEYLNDPTYGSKIVRVYVDFKATSNNAFYNAIKDVVLNDHRRATDVIIPDADHFDHFHWQIID